MQRIILFILSILTLILYGQNKIGEVQSIKRSNQLFPFMGNYKCGYIDKTGKIVIQPQFDYAGNFSQGLAVVGIAGKYGYIDKTGKIVIGLQFTDAEDFSEGLAPVMIGGVSRKRVGVGLLGKPKTRRREQDGEWGYIDKTGKFVINPQFDFAFGFSEELAVVVNYKIGRKTKDDGKLWSTSTYSIIKGGYIDKTGKMIIDQQFDEAGKFSEGLAPVRLDDGSWGYIDKSGELMIKLEKEYDCVWSFSRGLARVTSDRKYGYIDKTGKLVIGFIYDDAGDFIEGIAPVNIGAKMNWNTGRLVGGSWGYINKTGRMVIDLQFNNAFEFVNGLAVAEKDGRCWYIDKTGNFIPQPK